MHLIRKHLTIAILLLARLTCRTSAGRYYINQALDYEESL